MTNASPTALLLNVGHALDHLFLLIFATAASAVAAVLTGFLVKYAGWRVAFAVPALIALACGVVFVLVVPREDVPPAKRPQKMVDLPRSVLARVLTVMTLAAITGSLIFNFTTNGNGQLLTERLRGVVDDPAAIGALLAVVYTVASFAQLVVGKLIDRLPLKWVYVPVAAGQVPVFVFASQVTGWLPCVAMLRCMALVFGSIPFIDAMIVQYVDDRLRSRVAGIRLAVGFGVSSLAVYLLGPT